jgi:hypothetical protein
MWPRTLGLIGVKGRKGLRHRRRGSSSTMPALMETRAPQPPGSRFGRMIPQLARRSTSVRSSRDNEYARGEFVTFTAEELKALDVESSKVDLDAMPRGRPSA